MSIEIPILVTRAGGAAGTIAQMLRKGGFRVRAFVHGEDERAEALRTTGAKEAVGDLTRAADVMRALAEGYSGVFGKTSPMSMYLSKNGVMETWQPQSARSSLRAAIDDGPTSCRQPI